MKTEFQKIVCALFFMVLSISTSFKIHAQGNDLPKARSDFWNHVQIGGGIGASFGSGYTDITLAPGAIYNFNQYFSAGVGLNGSFVQYKRYSALVREYESWIYGGSIIGLAQPIPQIQLSVELEQLRVNTTFDTYSDGKIHDDFWSTGLFFGAGFRTQNVTIGLRYNVLHDSDKAVYAEPWMPFIRVYF
ncbi:hypothetical protein [Flavobacterium silvaticum]|uniref:Alpha-ketoglutarate decarboxylase n=1 Tax=Flavobacterium silvaticum TaxID=1852020 RepID=A0A972JG49_9FLAO|nr:hypothetical protein [Flavobacterium silvaticum]NMH28679.1 hypothetical protein [Flavobacterium silvaticum]